MFRVLGVIRRGLVPKAWAQPLLAQGRGAQPGGLAALISPISRNLLTPASGLSAMRAPLAPALGVPSLSSSPALQSCLRLGRILVFIWASTSSALTLTLFAFALGLMGRPILPVKTLCGKCRRDAFAQDVDVDIDLRSGINFNTVTKEIADKLSRLDAGTTESTSAVLNEFIKLTILIDVKRESGPVAITDFFVVTPGTGCTIRLCDRTMAKARLIESPIPEIQQKIDQLAALSTAEVHRG